MRRTILYADCEGKEFYVETGDFYRVVEFTPLEERIIKENPEMAEALDQLKSAIGDEEFARYISPLIAIKKSGGLLLIITGRERHRIILMERYYTHLKRVFQVEQVKIVKDSGL